jgi:hypothetical protein
LPDFSTDYYHADWQDGLGQTYGPWAGMPDAWGFADQLAIRDHAPTVPEPGSLAILTGSALSLGAMLLRRRRA